MSLFEQTNLSEVKDYLDSVNPALRADLIINQRVSLTSFEHEIVEYILSFLTAEEKDELLISRLGDESLEEIYNFIILACQVSSPEVLKLLITSASSDEIKLLILNEKSEKDGFNVLHSTVSYQTACRCECPNGCIHESEALEKLDILLDLIHPDDRIKILCDKTYNQSTLLHLNKSSAIVSWYLSVLPKDCHEVIILQKDKSKQTCLFGMNEAATAEMLLKRVWPHKREAFICCKDKIGNTALFIESNYNSKAARDGICETIKVYLKYLRPEAQENLLLHRNNFFRTALWYTNLKEVAELFLQETDRSMHGELIGELDSLKTFEKPFNAEQLKTILDNLDESVRYKFLNLQDEQGQTILYKQGSFGITSVVKDYIPEDEWINYVFHKDSEERTALHTIQKDLFAVRDLIESVPTDFRDKFIFQLDRYGNSALHKACNALVVSCILNYLTEDRREQLLQLQNNKGQTALHTVKNEVDKSILQFVDDPMFTLEPAQLVMLKSLSKRNAKKIALIRDNLDEVADGAELVLEHITNSDGLCSIQ